MAAVVDAEKCTGCGICEDACPLEAIKVEDDLARVGEECTECGSCVDECPNDAISLPG
jgi:NAD-dependent dihydropyrimidine dehydrogenase PreA subunit